MPITDRQYKVKSLGYEEDARYTHLLGVLQNVLERLYLAEGEAPAQALAKAHRDMVDPRLHAVDQARLLGADKPK